MKNCFVHNDKYFEGNSDIKNLQKWFEFSPADLDPRRSIWSVILTHYFLKEIFHHNDWTLKICMNHSDLLTWQRKLQSWHAKLIAILLDKLCTKFYNPILNAFNDWKVSISNPRTVSKIISFEKVSLWHLVTWHIW